MTDGLKTSLTQLGHNVEIVTVPFKFYPETFVSDLIDFWKNLDFNEFNGYKIDKLISLQFPSYYCKHENKTLWLMHQHRSVYDLYSENNSSIELKKLKEKITINDSTILDTYKHRYSMCKNVSNRLRNFNNLDSIPVYHPPAYEDRYYNNDSYDYVFFPSRLETLKRQDLLINAIALTKTPIIAIIAGIGGQMENYKKLIDKLNISHKVKLVGFISQEEKETYYARSLAVYFAPQDEDYGYITLEAMLSSKPVITCNDSGGPLEFIDNEFNGFILEPDINVIAQKLDWIYLNKNKVKQMGKNALQSYKDKNISWQNVTEKLLEN